jgi:putative cell wall-binding protein
MKQGFILALLFLNLIPSIYAQGDLIVLTSDNPADQAVATVLANRLGATLLVTPWGSLSDETLSRPELLTGVGKIVYVVGGDVAIPNAKDVLEGRDLNVIAIGGANRQETSLNVAERFGTSRAVVLDGYHTTAFEDGITLSNAEGIPIIFFNRGDPDFGADLRNKGIDRITLFTNPALDTVVKDSLEQAGVQTTEISKDEKNSAQRMIDQAEERINETAPFVRSIRDGPSLTAARFLVDAKVSLSKSKDSMKRSNYRDAFTHAVNAEEKAIYAYSIYDGRFPGSIAENLGDANRDISSDGLTRVKEDLQNLGSSYGVGLPVPPITDLESYMVDIPGYKKTDVREGTFFDMGAKYSKINEQGELIVGQFVRVEIFERTTESDAIKWMEQTEFRTGTESKDWILKTFEGFPANFKFVRYTGTDKNNQEVFLKVAIGNLGVFTKYTEGVDRYTPLTPQEDVQAMVEEVTREMIKEIELSR